MNTRKKRIGLLIPALLTLVLVVTACASGESRKVSEAETKNSLESSLEKAEVVRAEGKVDEAVTMLKALTPRFPADKTPWLRIAQIRFDAGDYSDAIIHAQEAIKRDPSEKAANSILALSGLRLATKSITDLRAQNALNGTVKNEVQDMKRMLREVVGEAPPSPQGKPAVALPARGKSVRKVAPASANDAGAGSGPNPFVNLK